MRLASNSPLVPEELEFHFNPGMKRASTYVNTPPFDLCYVLGSPGGFRLGGKIESVAADACYLNLFSNISETVDSDKDNYEQHWKALYPIELGREYSQPGYTPLGEPMGRRSIWYRRKRSPNTAPCARLKMRSIVSC